MVQVKTSKKFEVSADVVWDLIAGFDSLQNYHPAVESSVLEKAGAVRRLTLKEDGGCVVERLVSFDDVARTFAYKIIDLVDCGLPFKNYLSKVRVEELGANTCEVHWSSEFDAVDTDDETAAEAARGIYAGCYEGIESKVL